MLSNFGKGMGFVALAAILVGCDQALGNPVPSNQRRQAGEACHISVFDKSQNRSGDYCNALFDSKGNCGFAGYLNTEDLKALKEWGDSPLSRVSVPNSLWEANASEDPKTKFNKLCGKTITFTNVNGDPVKGIIADRMAPVTDATALPIFDTCEGGAWEALGFKKPLDANGNLPQYYNMKGTYVIED